MVDPSVIASPGRPLVPASRADRSCRPFVSPVRPAQPCAAPHSRQGCPARLSIAAMALPLDPDEPTRRLQHAGTSIELQRLGAMLAPIVFRTDGRPDFAPMQVAPWAEEPGAEAWPGILRRLRGDWPCVPFGTVERPPGLAPDWIEREPEDRHGHGYGSNHAWHWLEPTAAEPHSLALAIDYPPDHAVRRLERRVSLRAAADGPGGHGGRGSRGGGLDLGPADVVMTLSIEVRRPCVLPVALHPTFRLDAGAVRLHAAHAAAVHAYPVPAEPGVSRLQPGAAFTSLAAAPLVDGGRVDLTRLPLPFDTEELLQVQDLTGPLRLDYLDAGWSVELDWDRDLLPDAMLWISQRGRRHAPWNGRHAALGLEPLNASFDLARVASPPPTHPLVRRRGLALVPATPRVIESRLRAWPLAGARAGTPTGSRLPHPEGKG